MRILILGGAGMLGHQLVRQLKTSHEVWVTIRKSLSHYDHLNAFDPQRTISGIDVESPDAIETAFVKAKPEAVVNCVGIIKQLREASNPLISIKINSLLPHRLAQICELAGARLIHMSTDCVFSGQKGDYKETDPSDAADLYGRTKFLGEVTEGSALTIRTSIIGRELESSSGLIDWFLTQNGATVRGFRKAIYTGFTTLEMSRIIESILIKHVDLKGVWQVSSDKINKHELLCLVKKSFLWNGEITPYDDFICDRSLDSSRFRERANYQPPSWGEMIAELAIMPK